MELHTLRQEVTAELDRIIDYWCTHAIDREQGGVIGRIDNDNRLYPEAEKGVVLHARVLWTFSAAGQQIRNPELAGICRSVFDYLLQHFLDRQYGGVYWTVDHRGNPADTKKQVYAQAFAIYAFSEYWKFSGLAEAKEQAIRLYRLLVQHGYDAAEGGYFEGFAADWSGEGDLRLSEKEGNDKKTMNTHLHVLEAYTNLYRIWPDAALAGQIRSLLADFTGHIIDPATGHLFLFFDEHWRRNGSLLSYGHDIEASWLLLEAAEVLEDASLIRQFQQIALQMADAVVKGFDTDGGLWYEASRDAKKLIREKHWWPQAEALVGYLNAWQLSNDPRYRDIVLKVWDFVQKRIVDHQRGEWYWGLHSEGSIMQQDKAGLWKCPYHNGRACLELMRRLPA